MNHRNNNDDNYNNAGVAPAAAASAAVVDEYALLDLVVESYLYACRNNDLGNMTVSDVYRAVATGLGLTCLERRWKNVIKARLTELITAGAAMAHGTSKSVAAMMDGDDEEGEGTTMMMAMDGDGRTRKDDAAVALTENVTYVHAHTAPSRENDSFELKPEDEAVLRHTRVWHKWEQLPPGELFKYANYNFRKGVNGEDRKLLGRLRTIKANNKANADKNNKNKPEILVAEVIRCGMTIPVRVRVTRVIVNGQACHGQGKVTEKKGSESVDLWLWKFWDLIIQHMQNGKPSLLVPN